MRTAAALFIALALAACAGSQHPADPNPVSLGMWCEEVTATLCHAIGQRCGKSNSSFEASCQESARQVCLGGRDRSIAAGRTGDELRACVKQIDRLDCPGLNSTAGVLVDACATRVAAPAAAQP
jgi:hypothetical protein